jgi:hypothetical protein
MPISITSDGGNGGNSTASPGPTMSFTAPAGEAVIVCGLVFSASSTVALTGISDNAGGNTWHVSTSIAQKPPYQEFHAPSSGGYSVVFVGWCLSLVNPITSVSVADNSGLTDFWRVSVSSWDGIAQDDSGASSQSASTTTPGATVHLFSSGDLVVGVSNDDTASYTGSPSGGGAWADFTGAGSKPNIGYIFPGAAGSYTAQWTLGATDVAAAAVQAFSPVPVTAGGGLLLASFP